MLTQWLKQSNSTVVFTGAGMSTESGLRDFRSADKGMWNERNPMELATVQAMNEITDEFIKFYRWRIEEMQKHRPNDGHYILAKWEQQGIIEGIITQNVENYHELAGTKKIAKLHGDLGTLRCMDCGERYPADDYLPPRMLVNCPSNGCNGFVRPNIVLFGETLPQQAFDIAEQLISDVNLFIVLGSSLLVSPANEFAVIAKERGAKLVIVNHDPTPFDTMADLVLRDSIGDVLRSADADL